MTQSKWSNKFYVTTYELAAQGMKETQIADALGVSLPTFTRWKARKPALREAWQKGTKKREPNDEFSFRDYVFERLPPDLQSLWTEINACEEADNDIARIEAMLVAHGKRARQHLFIYALTASNFNISRAMRRLNINRKTFDDWTHNEPDFAKLLEEINWHKKNFFENALIGRVVAGDTAAILHAARTQLRDRGYNDRVDININNETHVHHHNTVNILDLPLTIEVRQAILAAIRVSQAPEPITIESTPVND